MSRARSGRPGRTAAELMETLRKDPAFLAREGARREAQETAVLQYQRAAGPLLEALAAAGFRLARVGELPQKWREYGAAVPVLVDWLPRLTDRYVKEDVVRALSVPWARPLAAGVLIEEFERLDADDALRWAIGNALEVVADTSNVQDLLRLSLARQHGKARQMVVLALARTAATAEVVEALVGLLTDGDVAAHAAMALGKLRAGQARPQLETVAATASGLLATEARRALAKL